MSFVAEKISEGYRAVGVGLLLKGMFRKMLASVKLRKKCLLVGRRMICFGATFLGICLRVQAQASLLRNNG